MDKAFYRIPEVAEILSLGKSVTYRLVAEGKIPSVWMAGINARRVPAVALKRFIEEQTKEGLSGDQ
ncbi:MAG: helix-turn-helix domain-containing protein [Fimbriimonadaceae bacterium]